MGIHILDDKLWFPNVEYADKDGLLAIGGDLSIDRLLLAYSSGIFPWYNDDEPILWWSPDPRCVLYPDDLRITKSMKSEFNKPNHFEFKINSNFESVIQKCAETKRKDQYGTWIHDEVLDSYCALHHSGFAWSAETYFQNQLVGGLYGIWVGDVFFGESMFYTMNNASKFAFVHWVKYLKTKGVKIIDCQVRTQHLLSLGASMISRKTFIEQIHQLL